jgi:hypothetical protein
VDGARAAMYLFFFIYHFLRVMLVSRTKRSFKLQSPFFLKVDVGEAPIAIPFCRRAHASTEYKRRRYKVDRELSIHRMFDGRDKAMWSGAEGAYLRLGAES